MNQEQTRLGVVCPEVVPFVDFEVSVLPLGSLEWDTTGVVHRNNFVLRKSGLES